MARTTITQITDDIDGSRNAEEVSFSFMGVDYTIDLARKNRAAFEKAMRPYIDAGTKVPSRARRRPSSRKPAARSSNGTDLKTVRAWAVEHGHDVSARGRIPNAVMDAYREAQG